MYVEFEGMMANMFFIVFCIWKESSEVILSSFLALSHVRHAIYHMPSEARDRILWVFALLSFRVVSSVPPSFSICHFGSMS
jgi:hypothetical protein